MEERISARFEEQVRRLGEEYEIRGKGEGTGTRWTRERVADNVSEDDDGGIP